mmetsp:Transcript_39167/g.28306  ORF Transcript_39167/g.28306 Transcript_39167/m.28306 type:complete len:99 (-) Transcript_39167:252-548(-)|eukprot:CAMPEP_0116880714 /NCGR_PEP_ID=MMETSP0463-20121206/12670_1 /TAXON_ID=181622 /ORGANISM="Strombidinopsis sp, Strain SopsisLIS2011" /LENGTH=98 /DNA_ID=CAMNT_0004531623 /DNA_START=795 /DNA_END=1091 /DNA_ORIENTATION=-
METQAETFQNLVDLKANNQNKLMDLVKKRDALQEELDKLKESGVSVDMTDGSKTGNNSGLTEDDLERNLNQIKVKEDQAQGKLDAKQKVIIEARSGIE